MAIGQAKTSRARRDKRRSHHHLHKPTTMVCPNCKNIKLTHKVCAHCGYYSGRQVVKPRET